VKGNPVNDSDLLNSFIILRVANVTTLVAKKPSYTTACQYIIIPSAERYVSSVYCTLLKSFLHILDKFWPFPVLL
jgi:hypothetical protein